MRIISGMLQNRKDALHLLIVKALYAAHLLLTVIRNTLAQHVFFNTGKKDYFKNFRLDESALETHELGLETEWTGHKLRLLQSWESEGFFQNFSRGGRKWWNLFFSHWKLRKQPFLLNISKSRGGQRSPPTPVVTIENDFRNRRFTESFFNHSTPNVVNGK